MAAKLRAQAEGYPSSDGKARSGLKRHVSPPLALQLKANTGGAVPYRRGPLANTPATVNVRSESAAADTSGEPGANGYSMKNAALAEIKFPRCDAAVRKIDSGDWELADAIVAECSETGDDGVRNESYALMNAMREEIAANHGVSSRLSVFANYRQVASAFPPGRRRPGVSLEGHLEAGTPDVLDALINSAPNGTTLTLLYIRGQKHPTEKAEQDQQKGRTPPADRGPADGFAKHLPATRTGKRELMREKEEREQRYMALCRSVGKKPGTVFATVVTRERAAPYRRPRP